MANYYNPYQFNPYAVNVPQYQQPIQQVQQQTTVQQGGYINVSSEQEAINYPIAPNTSLIFIDWSNKKVYEKTKGISPSDVPMMKVYNLTDVTKGEIKPEQEKPTNNIEYAEKSEIKAIYSEIDGIKAQLETLMPKSAKKGGKKDE